MAKRARVVNIGAFEHKCKYCDNRPDMIVMVDMNPDPVEICKDHAPKGVELGQRFVLIESLY